MQMAVEFFGKEGVDFCGGLACKIYFSCVIKMQVFFECE